MDEVRSLIFALWDCFSGLESCELVIAMFCFFLVASAFKLVALLLGGVFDG